MNNHHLQRQLRRVFGTCLLLLALSLCVIGGESADAQDAKEIAILGVRLRVPLDVKIKTRRPQADFVLIEFVRNHTAILNGYFGTAAAPFKTLAKTGKLGTGVVKMESSASNGRASREVLFDKGPWAWPPYIHLWYADLAPSDAALSDKIIADTLKRNK